MKKLVKAMTNSLGKYDSSPQAYRDSIFTYLVKRLWKHDRDLTRRQTYSTHKRVDGSLVYAQSESQHLLYMKVPDISFVGFGTWIYEKDPS